MKGERALNMADSTADLLAGAGGLVTDEAQSDHQGRKALLLVRNNEDCSEFVALAATMGISIVERIDQRGRIDAKWFMGQGKLQDVTEELRSAAKGHPWNGVDLILLHTNATPRQLVGVNDAVGIEVWDRVRLLLALFTAHASSVEARTQVRIARLQSDRTVLREVVKQQTTGERAGYGGAGRTAAGSVLTNVNRELAALKKRQRKQVKSAAERRRQRKQQAMTVGLAGYTNAGKSSLFRRLSGKEVLVEDRLFSTLESTLGRLESSPRVLLADTIGFIDGLPNSTLEAFRATLAEAIECDLLLLLVDVGDDVDEMERKLRTSIRELTERALDADETSIMERIQLVLTKCDTVERRRLKTSKRCFLSMASQTHSSSPRIRVKELLSCNRLYCIRYLGQNVRSSFTILNQIKWLPRRFFLESLMLFTFTNIPKTRTESRFESVPRMRRLQY